MMISEINIRNFKSIEDVTLPLGRVNVFIGENGAGKSNILEAIALAAAAAAEKLDNEFLASRGIRVTKPHLMRAGFDAASSALPIGLKFRSGDDEFEFELANDNQPYSKWTSVIQSNTRFTLAAFNAALNEINHFGKSEILPSQATIGLLKEFSERLAKIDATKAQSSVWARHPATANGLDAVKPDEVGETQVAQAIGRMELAQSRIGGILGEFLVYSPENSSLRVMEREGQIEPLGINGEGLLKLLNFHASAESGNTLDRIEQSMNLLGWLDSFVAFSDSGDGQILLKDRYLDEQIADFDQKSVNEGFFFLLFYFTLFNSDITPKFFAVDNIDASLNPKLCVKLMEELVALSKSNDKQVILTTHNPAILDGLNLDDDEQRLFVVSRGRNGSTRVKRVQKGGTAEGQPTRRLSELFLQGVIGGLPKGF